MSAQAPMKSVAAGGLEKPKKQSEHLTCSARNFNQGVDVGNLLSTSDQRMVIVAMQGPERVTISLCSALVRFFFSGIVAAFLLIRWSLSKNRTRSD